MNTNFGQDKAKEDGLSALSLQVLIRGFSFFILSNRGFK